MPNSARPGAGHPAGGASRLVWHPLRRFHRRGRPLDSPAGPRPWADAKDCTVPGAAAYQYSTCALGTEDCLKLDVYTTEKASKRPVIVYLHSGGNQIGSARELPGGFLAEQLGCVFVGLEYRLGLFGFNCLPAFCSGPEETGNVALLDMAKALDWVRDNIASFGGDPQNITVLGFAAGGRDGMALLASPLFVGRFQKAISISGGMTCADENTSAETLAAALAPLAVQDGKALTEAAARRWLLTEDPAVRSWLCGVDAARLAPLMANAGLRMSVFPISMRTASPCPRADIQRLRTAKSLPCC